MPDRTRFYATAERVPPSVPGTWAQLQISIYERDADDTARKIGGYIRNYSTLYNTFVPFQQDGEWYALYSRDYTATRVMKLPSCEDLGGEEPDGGGFCPTGYYVASSAKVGIVTGCIWGDDGSWKIQLLDLRRVREGKIVRLEQAFGYLELASDVMDLQQTVRSWFDITKRSLSLTLPVQSDWSVQIPESDADPLQITPAHDDFRLYVIQHRSKWRFLREDGEWGDETEARVFASLEKARAAVPADGRLAELSCHARLLLD